MFNRIPIVNFSSSAASRLSLGGGRSDVRRRLLVRGIPRLVVVIWMLVISAVQAGERVAQPESGQLPPLIIDVPLSSVLSSAKGRTVLQHKAGVYPGDGRLLVRVRFTNDTDTAVMVGPPHASCACTVGTTSALSLPSRNEVGIHEVAWAIPYQHGDISSALSFPVSSTGPAGQALKREVEVDVFARSSDALTAAEWTRLIRMDDIKVQADTSVPTVKVVSFQRGEYANSWDAVEVVDVTPAFLGVQCRLSANLLDLLLSCSDDSRLPFVGHYTGSVTLGFRSKGALIRQIKKGISGRILGPVRGIPSVIFLGNVGAKGDDGALVKDIILEGFATIGRCQIDPVLEGRLSCQLLSPGEGRRRFQLRLSRCDSGEKPYIGTYFKDGVEVSGTAINGNPIRLRLMIVGHFQEQSLR